MMKDKLKYYKSLLKTYSLYYKNSFYNLSKSKKTILILGPVILIAGLIVFNLRDKAEAIQDLADHSYTFDSGQGLQPFASFFPAIGEDILLEKMVVNLKQTDSHKFAMGMFEVFINIANLDFAPKIQENEHLLQDVMQRELESFTYDRLSTAQGKKVAKIRLKNTANKALGQKMIKKLYFKTFVVQP